MTGEDEVADVRADEELGRGVTLEQWCVAVKSGWQVLRIRNGRIALCLAHRESSVRWCLAPGWQGLLAVRQGLQVVSGGASVLPLPQTNLVKLQFFIDQGVRYAVGPVRGEPWAALSESGTPYQARSVLEAWYLALALQGHPSYHAFANQLRSSESYQLLGFLLAQGSSSGKLQDLAVRYGVSVSHFRRLCSQALGGAAKSWLREWRTARALLAMAEKPRSLTDVALEFGYASSSHFSNEIRELVGVAPSSLIDISRRSSE